MRKYHQIEKVQGYLYKAALILPQDIIEAQLKVLAEFPPINPRQQHIEQELKKDLDFVTENMKESPAGILHPSSPCCPLLVRITRVIHYCPSCACTDPCGSHLANLTPSYSCCISNIFIGNARKERMLSMHKDFVTVLSWFKNKLSDFAAELGITEEDGALVVDESSTKPTNKQVEFIQRHL